MSEKQGTRPVSVKILDKEYLVACTDDEYQDLLASAKYVDGKMREIRDRGKVVGADRIAVMAALNLAHELLVRKNGKQLDNHLAGRLKSLQEKIEDALYKTQQLDL